jgi:hypothetical protein
MKLQAFYRIFFSVFLVYFNTALHVSAAQNNEHGSRSDTLELHNILPIDQDILNSLNGDQLKWYQRFNEGVLFFDGWQDISQSILSQYPTEKRKEVRRFIQRMGIIIGTEWSKDNDIRRIDTDQLDSWGDRLKEAACKDNGHLTLVLAQIGDEVKTLLRD